MRIDISFLPALAAAFMLVFARIGTMVMLLPGLGELSVPVRVRLTVALVLAAVVLPLHRNAYQIDLRKGQKTGFYLDQRVNRRAVAGYCGGKRVLDLFCFTAGFSLNAVQAGAVATLGVDSSAAAIDAARRHAAMNGIDVAEFEAGDVLEVLERLRADRRVFDAVICDPPKYARQAKDVEHALKG